jgi:hypothetical protein
MGDVSVAEMVEQIEEAVEDEEFELTEWETEFLENIKRRIANDVQVSGKQEDSLLTIWNRAKGAD